MLSFKKKIRVCYTFILIIEFTIIYLLYVLFILKVENNFEKRKSSHAFLFIYGINTIDLIYPPHIFKYDRGCY